MENDKIYYVLWKDSLEISDPMSLKMASILYAMSDEKCQILKIIKDMKEREMP